MTMSESESLLCSSKTNIDVSIPFFPKGIRADVSDLLGRLYLLGETHMRCWAIYLDDG